MNSESPRRKGILKKPITKRLRRGIGQRHLIHANGSATQSVVEYIPDEPKPPLMFANTTRVRPFNFRSRADQASSAMFNRNAALVTGKNARGKPPTIGIYDPRKSPFFAEAMGTNLEKLETTMATNTATRDANLKAYRKGSANPNVIFRLPVKNILRTEEPPMNRVGAKEMRLMAAQYEMGHSVPELNQLSMEGANNAYVAAEAAGLMRPYHNQAAYNQNIAYESAEFNAKIAQKIANQVASGRARSRRNRRSRKTRRNRK